VSVNNGLRSVPLGDHNLIFYLFIDGLFNDAIE
jgi:hypothetical protein